LKLLNSPLALILPGCVGAYNVFVFRTFFQNIPAELPESARIDGANDFTILFRIILPLSKALLATFGLFTIVGSWNSWFSGLIYLKNPRLYPVQLILREYLYVIDVTNMQGRAGMGGVGINPNLLQLIAPKGVRMSMVVVTMFPIMMIYPFFQKYFVKGVMIGAVKG
jgi:putative aldouronate transport system permease protein